MNRKFFGNSLDLFKFDIISYLCGAKHIRVKNIDDDVNNPLRKAPILKHERFLYYVSMLTSPPSSFSIDNTVYVAYNTGLKNVKLCSLLKECLNNNERNIREIDSFFNEAEMQRLLFFDNEDGYEVGYFENKNRKDYFDCFIELYHNNQEKREKKLSSHQRLNSSLVFLDPDNGYMDKDKRGFRSNKNAYILSSEILQIRNSILSSDLLGFFQILKDKKIDVMGRKHELENKINKPTVTIFDNKVQASLVFVLENEEQQNDLKEKLEKYLIDYPNIGDETRQRIV